MEKKQVKRRIARRSSDRLLMEIKDFLDRIDFVLQKREDETFSCLFDIWKIKGMRKDVLGRRTTDLELEKGILENLESIAERLVQLRGMVEDLEKVYKEKI